MRTRQIQFPAQCLRPRTAAALVCFSLLSVLAATATPANKATLARHYDRFLSKELDRCTTCHAPSAIQSPENLDEFPHNPFGHRLRVLGQELTRKGLRRDLATRLSLVARDDSDRDGVANETEILLGHNPGDPKDTPTKTELATVKRKRDEFGDFLSSYHWEPFQPVKRPAVPKVKNAPWVRHPVDAFLAAEHQKRKLQPRPAASPETLLRRVYLDLIGLSPTPAEQRAFLADPSSDAYEKTVDRLLADPRYGERWARHWMDVWRYSDWAGWTDGGQVRDSKPHIWRWRDWIVESLNNDKPYDRMILEMLAADELAPEDTNALRATGFLVRNYKMLSREQWLEDTIKHTAQAFLGLTVGCAKCHDHMFDPISQKEYYQVRAIFEPHQVRTDRVPGQTNTALNGLVRVFDTDTNALTYFYLRGDERHPDTNRVMKPSALRALGGQLKIEPVKLPHFAAFPDKREFVIRDTIAAGEKALAEAREVLAGLKTNASTAPEKLQEQELQVDLAAARHTSLLATLRAETFEDQKESEDGKKAATEAAASQRALAVMEAKMQLYQARSAQTEARAKAEAAAQATNAVTSAGQASADKDALKKAQKTAKDLAAAKEKVAGAEKALAEAEREQQSAPTLAYKPRLAESYPSRSSGRRLAFAQWIAQRENPLTARVAVNQIWLRHFGQGLVATPADFGRNGRPPSHPQLLDWLAAEFMAQGWSMKAVHRLLVTSSAYRMASTPDEADATIDPDNVYFWRMNSRRLEAEVVRDNLLYLAGELDPALGGPDIDHKLGLSSKRRSLYLRIAAEKEVEFLKIFDGPSVTECYLRKPSVVPQQALALANSELTLREARALAQSLSVKAGADAEQFITQAFWQILARGPKSEELRLCGDFLAEQSQSPRGSMPKNGSAPSADNSAQRARENLVLVLFNHNDFVTAR